MWEDQLFLEENRFYLIIKTNLSNMQLLTFSAYHTCVLRNKTQELTPRLLDFLETSTSTLMNEMQLLVIDQSMFVFPEKIRFFSFFGFFDPSIAECQDLYKSERLSKKNVLQTVIRLLRSR